MCVLILLIVWLAISCIMIGTWLQSLILITFNVCDNFLIYTGHTATLTALLQCVPSCYSDRTYTTIGLGEKVNSWSRDRHNQNSCSIHNYLFLVYGYIGELTLGYFGMEQCMGG